MAAAGSAILFANEARTVILVDGPRSIEEAQVPSRELARAAAPGGTRPTRGRRRLVSTRPPDVPFPTPEPRGDAPGPQSPAAQLAELMTAAAVEDALQVLRARYAGPWCLPRVVAPPPQQSPGTAEAATAASSAGEKRKRRPPPPPPPPPPEGSAQDRGQRGAGITIPEGSAYLCGTVEAERGAFLARAPARFDLVVLDPPWPNRSARRKTGGYAPAGSLAAVRATLSLVPVRARLAPGGLAAVWVTNSPGAAEVLTAPGGGVLAEWGLELVGEWTWLKVTTAGEPVCGVGSRWRKPWERLLVARRAGAGAGAGAGWPARRRVIVSVPDVHSRKPNLRPLFEEFLPASYNALEVFARSLTAGWWSWGDEVLEFQKEEHWVTDPEAHDEPDSQNQNE